MNKILIMSRDPQTGELGQEAAAIAVDGCEYLYSIREEDGDIVLTLTCPGDIADWECEAIYDAYDEGAVFAGLKEREGLPNPAWTAVLPFNGDAGLLEGEVNRILKAHKAELESVMEAIVGLAADYEKRQNGDA